MATRRSTLQTTMEMNSKVHESSIRTDQILDFGVVNPRSEPEKSQSETHFITKPDEGKNEDINTSLYDVLRPFLWSLRVSGMYYLDENHDTWTVKSILSFGYCLIIQGLILASTCYMFLKGPSITSIDSLVHVASSNLLFIYLNLIGVTFLSFSLRPAGWRKFFSQYKELQQNQWTHKIDNLKKRCYIYTIISWMFTTLHISLFLYVALDSSTNLPYQNPLCIVAMSIAGGMYILSVTHPVILSDLIATNFSSLNDDLDQCSKQSPLQFCEKFHMIKEMHHGLCKLTDSSDTIISPLMVLHVVFSIIHFSGSLYLLLYNYLQLDTIVFYISFLYGMSVSAIRFLLSTGCVVRLHEHAHGIFDALHTIQTQHLSNALSLQMTLFATKLMGSSIGFTFGKMFIIDKNVTLSIVGLLITYFFLLIQFRPSSISQTDPECNCTTWLTNITEV